MKIDPAIFAICVGLVNLVVMICGGVAAFVKVQLTLSHHRELGKAEHKSLQDGVERELRAIREKLDDHIHDNREDLGALSLAQKADQAAAANIHDATRENRIDIDGLKEWRREVTRRNGPQPPALGA